MTEQIEAVLRDQTQSRRCLVGGTVIALGIIALITFGEQEPDRFAGYVAYLALPWLVATIFWPLLPSPGRSARVPILILVLCGSATLGLFGFNKLYQHAHRLDAYTFVVLFHAALVIGPLLVFSQEPASKFWLARFFVVRNRIERFKIVRENPYEQIDPGAVEVAFALRVRAYDLREANSFLISVILMVLLGAAVFVVLAGRIAELDTQSLDTISPIRSSVREAERELETLELERTNAKMREAELRATRIEQKIASPELAAELASLQNELRLIESRVQRAEENVKNVRDVHWQALKHQATADRSGADDKATIALLLAAGISRFGVLALAIYLVQVLLRVYQYNALLSATHFAQADALLLGNKSPTDLENLMKSLRPTVGFGKPDATIPERVLDKVAGLMEVAATRARGSTVNTSGGVPGKI